MAPSAIANAFAGMTQSVDIPKMARDGKAGSYAEVQSFLTPPNSISPNLPPQGFRRQVSAPNVLPPSQEVDSEIDLQDADGREPEHGLDIGAATLDSAGSISPALLAKHHLPEILLHHGPLAIRHVMGYLTTTVPGFGGIPPTKARRLVVGALEGRGNGGSGGPYNPEVIFEKVGWGRWDARLRGQPPREQANRTGNNISPPPSAPSSFSGASNGLAIPKNQHRYERASIRTKRWARGSGTYSNDDDIDENEDMNMLEHEADKMSLDGASSSSSEAEEGDEDDEVGDATDDEDWAGMGAEALRKASVSSSIGNRNYLATKLPLRHRGSSSLAKSSPAVHISSRLANSYAPGGHPLSSHHHFGHATESQERDAIEALVALRSV